MRDPAFQSQEFAQRSDARKEAYLLQQGQIAGQGIPGVVQQFQQGQQHQQETEIRNGTIAGQLIDRQLAQENLQWAQQLHQTDMLAAQKRAVVAQSDLAVAQAQAAQEALGHAKAHQFNFTEDEVARMNSMGHALTFQGGRVDTRDATQEEMERGKAYLETKANLAKWRTPEEGAEAGEVWDSKLRNWRTGTEEETNRVLMRHQTGLSRISPTTGSRELTALTNPLLDAEKAALKRKDDSEAIIKSKTATEDEKVRARVDLATANADLAEVDRIRKGVLRRGAASIGITGTQPPAEGPKQPQAPQSYEETVLKNFQEFMLQIKALDSQDRGR